MHFTRSPRLALAVQLLMPSSKETVVFADGADGLLNDDCSQSDPILVASAVKDDTSLTSKKLMSHVRIRTCTYT